MLYSVLEFKVFIIHNINGLLKIYRVQLVVNDRLMHVPLFSTRKRGRGNVRLLKKFGHRIRSNTFTISMYKEEAE